MSEKTFKGKVKAKVIELRFATSGKLASLSKKRGDIVKKGELIASLDKSSLQLELDRQLGDYEKKRSEFEIFNLQKGEPTDELTKYLKTGKQAELNVSVKDVEIVKAKLDQVNLFSPIGGIIIDDSDLVPGIYITPASSPIKVLDTSSYSFEIEIEQSDLPMFLNPRPMTIKILGLERTYTGNSRPIISSVSSKLLVEIELQDETGLILGLEGEAY